MWRSSSVQAEVLSIDFYKKFLIRIVQWLFLYCHFHSYIHIIPSYYIATNYLKYALNVLWRHYNIYILSLRHYNIYIYNDNIVTRYFLFILPCWKIKNIWNIQGTGNGLHPKRENFHRDCFCWREKIWKYNGRGRDSRHCLPVLLTLKYFKQWNIWVDHTHK